MNVHLKEKIKKLPDLPGVYIFKSSNGEILYIGKAKSLKKRVNSYFGRIQQTDKTRKFIEEISNIDYIIVSNQAEALIVESRLIKEEFPKYNVMYRDDKSYPFVEITSESFPRICITRDKSCSKSIYIGPFTNVKLLRQVLDYLRKVIPYRVCKNMPTKACLDYDLNLCPAPCENRISSKEYNDLINKVKMYLLGNKRKLINELENQMKVYAQDKEFEKAAETRDKIKALYQIVEDISSNNIPALLYIIKKEINLKNIPLRIEAFDVSNLYGSYAVGSMVFFLNGKANKKYYRKFKIKNVSTLSYQEPNDYEMIKEILIRRYEKVLKENITFPDLIIIDGGKGHLNIALRTLEKIGIKDVDVISIAKSFDYIYHKEKNKIKEYKLKGESVRLIQRIRDESHRFAKLYHCTLRDRRIRTSELDNIPGIGPKRKKILLSYFKDIQNIKKSSKDELLKVNNINDNIADNILNYFKTRDKKT